MKTNRWFMIVAIVALTMAMFQQTSVKAEENDALKGWAVTAGYKNIQLNGDGTSFIHDTHPADAFLPRSGIPGSAGETSIESRLHFGSLGFRYQNLIIPQKLSYNIDIGGMFGGDRDSKQNDNDPRPAATGAFIYSEANFGLYGAVGMSYHFQGVMRGLYLGAEAQMVGIFVDHGYDRWGKDQSVESKLLWTPSVGPKLGYEYQNFDIELSAQIGKSVGISLTFALFF